MLAIIKIGGQQHIVKPNDIINTNKLFYNVGEEFIINDVISLVANSTTRIGNPIVSGASVKIKLLEHFKDDKVIIFKRRRRKNYRRKTGHRQPLSRVQILEITG